LSKVIERIKNHPAVEFVSDEREYRGRPPAHDPDNGNGFWVYLKPGFFNPSHEVHCIHEPSPSACLPLLRDVRPCEPGCECGHVTE
jgi:hypothetical protein